MKKFFNLLLVVMIAFIGLSFSGCGGNKAKYEIFVKTLHNYGYVNDVSGTYTQGDNVTLIATPITSSTKTSKFLGWLQNGKVVSTQQELSIEVNQTTAGEYLALFECPNIEYFYLNLINFNICTPNEDIPENQIGLKNIEIKASTIDEHYSSIYTAEAELFSNDANLSITLDTLYDETKKPFAFDMQSDLYLEIVVTYTQFEEEYTCSTKAKITGTNDVTKENLKIDKNYLTEVEADKNALIINPAKNVKDETLVLNTNTNSYISLEFTRISEYFNSLAEDTE